jgi:hypothetical protein
MVLVLGLRQMSLNMMVMLGSQVSLVLLAGSYRDQFARLAVQGVAERGQGAEAHGPCPSVFEDGQVGQGQADSAGGQGDPACG